MKVFQCQNCGDCTEHFESDQPIDKPEFCASCKSMDIKEVDTGVLCDICGVYCELDKEGNRTIYSGPHQSLCENCVPRDFCSCNSFSSLEAAAEYNLQDSIKEIEPGLWVVLDDKGRIMPCVDWI